MDFTMKMLKTHQLLKLRIETIQNLKRLKNETGLGSIDGLLDSMIKIMDDHRLKLKNTGWS